MFTFQLFYNVYLWISFKERSEKKQVERDEQEKDEQDDDGKEREKVENKARNKIFHILMITWIWFNLKMFRWCILMQKDSRSLL